MTHSLGTQKQLERPAKGAHVPESLALTPDLKSSLGVEGQRREFQLEEVGEAGAQARLKGIQ